jgi:Prolyl oligopeptidase, N-terminal beta-propeller domain
VDDYFGTNVADPYRPLEDTDSEATRKWIGAENKLTFGRSSQKSTAENSVLMMAGCDGFVGRLCQTPIPIGVSQKRPTITTAPAAHEIRQSP